MHPDDAHGLTPGHAIERKEPTMTLAQIDEYLELCDEEVAARTWEAKRALGDRVTILGHHYQRDEVIQFADHRGDSLELSRRAAGARSPYIVFCGVYFMAETAAILCQPSQTVMQPVLEALCPMARLANARDIAQAWEALTGVWGDDLMPITYQNSIAEAKAAVGRRDGAVCTSSNAARLFDWGFARKGHLLFIPDEHLGTNTALAMGIPPEQIGVWDPAEPPDPTSLADCCIVVWRGYCYVHTGFTVEDVERVRAAHPDALIVVHPECPKEVVALADSYGSTTGIIRFVERAPAGATVVVGTEWHLVNRLAQEHPDKTVLPLAQRGCRTMGMTRMHHLLYILESVLAGEPRHIISVDEETAHWARLALQRMLEAS